MRYFDIKNQADNVSLYDAVVDCVTTDGGLYLPDSPPRIPNAFINNMEDMTLREIAYAVNNLFLSPEVDSAAVKSIVDKAFAFDIPLQRLSENRFVLELFHGPTMAFKDYGVIFMAELLRYFGVVKSMPVKVVVASSGNTASAVANAFSAIDGVDVYILVPRNSSGDMALPKWTPDMANIRLIEVAGNIDDCKSMITSAFADKSLRDKCILTSCNSVNISRIISQIALFFYAVSRLKLLGLTPDNVALSLPSGNLSMLTSGILAKSAGLRCGKLVAACNANNVFDIYLNSSQAPHKSVVPTLARYMDTAMPLNLPRISALYNGNTAAVRNDIQSATVSDQMIADTIVRTYNETGYSLDPHAAVAMAALNLTAGNKSPGVLFATAAPQRSAQLLKSLSVPVPEQKAQGICFDCRSWRRNIVPPTYPALRKALLE